MSPKLNSADWWEYMSRKYGSREQAEVFFKAQGARANQANNHLKVMKEADPEKLRAIASKGGRISRRKKPDGS